MAPSLFCRSISSESFGFDCHVRYCSFDAESFISVSLALFAASSPVRSSQVTRSVGIAATLQFGLVCFYSFSIPVYVRLMLRS
jgi:hypothetical protein